MHENGIYQASNTRVFGLVECPAQLIPTSEASFMVQFPVVAWGLHRDGIIMVSCGAYCSISMTKEVCVIFLYPSKSDVGPHRNRGLTKVIRAPSTFLRKL